MNDGIFPTSDELGRVEKPAPASPPIPLPRDKFVKDLEHEAEVYFKTLDEMDATAFIEITKFIQFSKNR